LKVDGGVVNARQMPHCLAVAIGSVETFKVGAGTPADANNYKVPLRFIDKLEKLSVKLGPEHLTPRERELIYGT